MGRRNKQKTQIKKGHNIWIDVISYIHSLTFTDTAFILIKIEAAFPSVPTVEIK